MAFIFRLLYDNCFLTLLGKSKVGIYLTNSVILAIFVALTLFKISKLLTFLGDKIDYRPFFAFRSLGAGYKMELPMALVSQFGNLDT